MSITDILTLLSQVVLLGTSALGAAMAFYPEIISSRISSYKDRLIERRHQRMVAHLASDRPHVFEEVGGSSDGVDHLPHEEVARGLREGVLDATPVRRYSIVVGPPGSGKSSVVRAAVQGKAGVGGGKRCDYVARLSLRLVATASSLVDALSEEVGCDLEDWTERLLSSYLFAGPQEFSHLSTNLRSFWTRWRKHFGCSSILILQSAQTLTQGVRSS
ncbi:hypothetical protein BJ742DRAFT_247362 [Cladochytrium replicatum]|nr:hypothetical protein BJ742DRAFT_247362 [Cladochytrium replicatum]